MSLYSIAAFAHVVGALGLFVAMGLEWVIVARVRHAGTAEQARDWLDLLGVIRWLSPASMATLLLAGIYMAVTAWGGAPWILAAFAGLVLLPAMGAITLRRLPRIAQEISGESGPPSDARRRDLDDPLLTASIQTRTALALGIVFLMTNKPDAVGSVATIVTALMLGLAFSWPALTHAIRERGKARGVGGDAAGAESPPRDVGRAT